MYPRIQLCSLEIGSYVLCGLAAFTVSALLMRRELVRNHYPKHVWLILAAVGLPAGTLGSKVYDVLEKWDLFVLSPFEVFFRLPGQAWYGAFIAGSAATALALRMMRLPVLNVFDLAAPVIPLGHALGRLGCFLSGCCHGIPSSVPWALPFPHGLYPADVPVHPTQLYEMLAYLCISAVLWKMRDRETADGVRIGLYLVLSGCARLAIEFYRLNPPVMLHLTAPQWIAMAGMSLGLLLLVKGRRESVPRSHHLATAADRRRGA